ncbi:MAG: 4-alpha-glucanotransferase, partial [Synechococcus sp. SB0662_bin_45]|nr:4-alpha-glucanotransferase [Synechococcus sp. SB0662_bin_45]
MKARLKGRRAGVLLHPTSLGGTPACGGFGREAAAWISALAHHGLSAWQVLPLAPTDPSGSPYNAPSASASSTRFLDGVSLRTGGRFA